MDRLSTCHGQLEAFEEGELEDFFLWMMLTWLRNRSNLIDSVLWPWCMMANKTVKLVPWSAITSNFSSAKIIPTRRVATNKLTKIRFQFHQFKFPAKSPSSFAPSTPCVRPIKGKPVPGRLARPLARSAVAAQVNGHCWGWFHNEKGVWQISED